MVSPVNISRKISKRTKINAVSYTHLDVYKRQVESSAAYHGFQPLPSQVCPTPSSSNKDMESLVAEVTKKVMEQLNK